jgi:hypothetical protein
MRRIIVVASAFIFLSFCAYAQQTPQNDSVMVRGRVQHAGTSATVLAHQSRPLHSAISAIAEEYGWLVEFEDPPYRSRYDLVDSTDPEWRANHPLEKGVTRIAGEAFQSQYQEGPDLATASGEERVLTKVVTDYNKSGNPGKFVVRRESESRYAVIGQSVKDDNDRDQEVPAILDTPVSVASQTRGARETVQLILSTLSARTGQKVALMSYPANIFRTAQVTIGGTDVTARQLLLQTLDQASERYTMRWSLLFRFDENTYFLNVTVCSQVNTDPNGRQWLAPVLRSKP